MAQVPCQRSPALGPSRPGGRPPASAAPGDGRCGWRLHGPHRQTVTTGRHVPACRHDGGIWCSDALVAEALPRAGEAGGRACPLLEDVSNTTHLSLGRRRCTREGAQSPRGFSPQPMLTLCSVSHLAEARHSSSPWQGLSPAKTQASSRPSRAPGPYLRHTARNGPGTVDHQS